MATLTPAFTQIASGLRFPEGPVAMPDGSVVLVEIARQTLSRVTPDGKVHVIAGLDGGPNGAALGPGPAWSGSAATRCSTRLPSTARATSAWRR